jgi:hypothetical protein
MRQQGAGDPLLRDIIIIWEQAAPSPPSIGEYITGPPTALASHLIGMHQESGHGVPKHLLTAQRFEDLKRFFSTNTDCRYNVHKSS